MSKFSSVVSDENFKKYYTKSTKINVKLFREIVSKFNTAISDKIIYDGYSFTMPYKLGDIRIDRFRKKFKIDPETGLICKKKLKMDYSKTLQVAARKYPGLTNKQLWEKLREDKSVKRVYHYNDHTDNIVVRWYWDKYCSNVKNRVLYKLFPTKRNRIELGKFVLENPTRVDMYIERMVYTKKLL